MSLKTRPASAAILKYLHVKGTFQALKDLLNRRWIRLELNYLKYMTDGIDKDAALVDLMNKYGDDVWNFAFFLVRRSDVADDLCQEVFLAAYDKLHAYRGESSVKSWLLAITRNKAYQHLRSAFISKVTLMDYLLPRETAKSAEAEAFDRLDTKHIWDTVMGLPVKFREVIVLDAYYQLAVQEMAAMLGVPEGTAKSRLHRARMKLSSLLAMAAEQEGEGQS